MLWSESNSKYLSFLGVVLTVLIWYLNRKKNYWKKRNVPHRKPIIFFGHFHEIILKREFPGNYFKKLYGEFEGPYVGFLAFTKPILLIRDLNIIKNVLIKNFNSFHDRLPIADEKIDPFLANALFGVKGDQWRILRTKLSPVFTTGKIKAMFQLMKECGGSMVKYIGSNNNGESTEVKSTVAKYTTDVISSCAFGINANSYEREDSELRAAGKKLVDPSFLRTLKALTYFMIPEFVKLFKYPFLDSDAAGFLREAFNETIEKREQSKVARNDLIDILINLKNKDDSDFKFYGDRLVAQAIIFFVAGQETTSQVISFTIHELCIHTDIQERLRIEIEDCVTKHGDLTYEAIADMKYLDMVVSETLRKYPTVPFLQRVCTENFTIPETGLLIEKDNIVLISPLALHWDPKYFPNPEKFDPERFNEKNKENIVPYTYMPFGDGPRNCIGERFGLLGSKLGIIYLIRNFEVKRNSLTQEPLIFSSSGLANVQGGIQVTFSKL